MKNLFLFIVVMSTTLSLSCSQQDSSLKADEANATTSAALQLVNTSSCEEIKTSPHPGISKGSGCMLIKGGPLSQDKTKLLQYAISSTANFKRKLYIEGKFFIRNSIIISSNAHIEGTDSNTAIHAYLDNGAPPIIISKNARDIFLKNFKIAETNPIFLAALLLSGRNTNINLQKIRFVGQKVTDLDDQQRATAIFSANDWVDTLNISNSSITSFQSGIKIVAPVWNLKVSSSEILKWTDYAVYIGQNRGHVRRTKNINIINNQFHTPARGLIRQLIMITRGAHEQFVKDVLISRNQFSGAKGAYVRGDLSTALGDMVILHGVNGFRILDNHIRYGGENGVTISRLSRNGTILRNHSYGHDFNGFNIGSGGYELRVDDASNFHVGDTIKGSTSGTIGDIDSIDFDILVLNKVRGGGVFHQEVLQNVTTGDDQAAKAISSDRTKKVLLKDNVIYNNGSDILDSSPVSQGVLITNADSIDFEENQVYDDLFPNQVPSTAVRVNNSRNICFSKNTYQKGSWTFTRAVALNKSSWTSNNCQ